ncbi:Alpha/beta hydrolase family protein [Methyloligella halotolerans]|uniref:Alpha/beta hydrolase family protein n=1 Tax=Methyloligella halotolerans TaxID=1177755 RepID=A0A1E2S3G4_9HYPH|nr:alpha/beta hydrolase [Methyloligella halotolerans]ODA68940.1 Alpha/beta hydrolase family protein [Methyloligella halotolerans]
MHFVLVHGWGFHPGIFDALAERLEGEVSRVDLGFVSGGPQDALKPSDDWPRDAIAIGHSLGVLWLLHERPQSFRALVSLQGFDAFAAHIGRAKVAAMRKALERDPYGFMRMFWKGCGADPFVPEDALNVDRLGEGLDWLMTWDESEARATLDRPILPLASRDDVIVPQAISATVWREAVEWSGDCGHLLPARYPAWCADRIMRLADEVGAERQPAVNEIIDDDTP